MRLIDADAIPWTDLNADMPNSKIKVLVAFADKINRMPTIEPERKTGRWIPCSERLPEKDGDYIVTFEKGYASDYGLDPIGIAPFEVDCEGFGFWQEDFDMHTLGSLGTDWVDINVIAWMEKPEPYKEGGVV